MIIDKLTELALNAGNGDESAMEELLPIVMSKAKAIAIKQLWHHSLEEIEDLSQDILYRFLKSLSSFKGKAKFNSWFDRLALNTCVSNYRKTITKWRQPVFIEQQEGYIPDYDIDLDCYELIKLCTLKQELVIRLVMQGNNYSEIASQLDIEYEAARSYYRRGIKRIQLRHIQHGCSTNT